VGNSAEAETDGVGTNAKFISPYGITVDSSSGIVYNSDRWSNRIRKTDPSGSCSAGQYFTGGACTSVPAGYYKPKTLLTDVYYVCSAGFYSTGGVSACTSCPTGSSSDAGSSVCLYPTAAPTPLPSAAPSAAPTAVPSRPPTALPTASPTHSSCVDGAYASGGSCVIATTGEPNLSCLGTQNISASNWLLPLLGSVLLYVFMTRYYRGKVLLFLILKRSRNTLMRHYTNGGANLSVRDVVGSAYSNRFERLYV
jgi:hypothetical protein